MHNRKLFFIFIHLILSTTISLTLAVGIAHAKNGTGKNTSTKYVTDALSITMRSGQGNEYRIIRSLDSGTKLRVIKQDKNYTQVKTDSGETGWVLSRYLVEEPIARTVLPPTKEKLNQLETQFAELSKNYKEINKERKELIKIAEKYEKLDKTHKNLMEEMTRLQTLTNDADKISSQNEELTKSNASLIAQRDILEKELKDLRDGNNRLWFLTGAGVIFIGIVIGSMLTRGRKNKSSSWGSGGDTLVLRQP